MFMKKKAIFLSFWENRTIIVKGKEKNNENEEEKKQFYDHTILIPNFEKKLSYFLNHF